MANRKNSGPAPATSATAKSKRFNRGKDGTYPLDKNFQPKPGGVVEELGGDTLQTLRVTWSNETSFFVTGEFWRDLETILANCDQSMLRHGWDRKAGNGRDFPGDRTAEQFSELWYAGKIGSECWNLLNWHRERGPNEVALSQALYLGRLLSDWEWQGFKKTIHTGKRVRNGAKQGGEMSAEQSKPKTKKVMVEMSRLIDSGKSISCAAKLAADKGVGKSTQANQRLWSRNKKAGT